MSDSTPPAKRVRHDDDVAITRVIASPMPHVASHCLNPPCKYCFCFVCDVPVAQCAMWEHGHKTAISKSPFNRTERQIYRMVKQFFRRQNAAKIHLRELLAGACNAVRYMWGPMNVTKVLEPLAAFLRQDCAAGAETELFMTLTQTLGNSTNTWPPSALLNFQNICVEIARCVSDCYRAGTSTTVAPLAAINIFEPEGITVKRLCIDDLLTLVHRIAASRPAASPNDWRDVDAAMRSSKAPVTVLHALYCQVDATIMYSVRGELRQRGLRCLLADMQGRKRSFSPHELAKADVVMIPYTDRRHHCMAYNGTWWDKAADGGNIRLRFAHGATVVCSFSHTKPKAFVATLVDGPRHCLSMMAYEGGRNVINAWRPQPRDAMAIIRLPPKATARQFIEALNRGNDTKYAVAFGNVVANNTLLEQGFPLRNGQYSWPHGAVRTIAVSTEEEYQQIYLFRVAQPKAFHQVIELNGPSIPADLNVQALVYVYEGKTEEYGLNVSKAIEVAYKINAQRLYIGGQ